MMMYPSASSSEAVVPTFSTESGIGSSDANPEEMTLLREDAMPRTLAGYNEEPEVMNRIRNREDMRQLAAEFKRCRRAEEIRAAQEPSNGLWGLR